MKAVPGSFPPLVEALEANTSDQRFGWGVTCIISVEH